jgi:hypothetical protein
MQVTEQPINVTFPFGSVRMLMVQPYLELQEPRQEPFPLSPACQQRQFDVIDNVFGHYQTVAPQLILFPEFALPGVEGVERVADRMSLVESPTIAIAGVRGLRKNEYSRLCALQNVAPIDPSNSPDRVTEDEWVNTSVTFIKDNSGGLSLWLQPKISPSWPEANANHQSMFHGTVVRLFRARFDNDVPCRFLTVLCFDWVGRENGVVVLDTILEKLNEVCHETGSPQDLHWVFVLQHNDSPNHPSFLNATSRFLTQTTPQFVRRQDAAAVMVCTATSQKPARSGPFGYSSLIFGPRAPFDSIGCQPTFATQSARLRGSADLGTCKDVLFREMGECMHAADVRVPSSVVANVTDRTAALARATVLPLLGTVVDRRVPGSQVPAVVKWTNDELDDIPDICGRDFNGASLQAPLRDSHERIVASYRRLRSQDLAFRIDGACACRAERAKRAADAAAAVNQNYAPPDPAADVDTVWGTAERQGLRHIIETLTLIGSVAPLDAESSQLHARHQFAGSVEIAAICGSTHTACVNALKRLADRTHAPILLITRDENNHPYRPREVERFADPRGNDGVKFTDSQTLFMAAQAKPVPEYTQFIAELLNVQDRPII